MAGGWTDSVLGALSPTTGAARLGSWLGSEVADAVVAPPAPDKVPKPDWHSVARVVGSVAQGVAAGADVAEGAQKFVQDRKVWSEQREKMEKSGASPRMMGYFDARYAGWGHHDEAYQGIFQGWGLDFDKKVMEATHGKEYAEGYDQAIRQERAKYYKQHWVAAPAANLAGSAASMYLGGRAAGPFLPAGLARGMVGTGAASHLAGVGGAAAGAAAGYEEGGDWQHAAEGGAAGYSLATHPLETLASAAVGAFSGAGEAGEGHRVEGAIGGGVAGGAVPVAARFAGKAIPALARAADAKIGYVGSRALDTLKGDRSPGTIPAQRAAERRIASVGRHDTVTTKNIEAESEERAKQGLPPAKAYQSEHAPNLRKLFRVSGRKLGPDPEALKAEMRAVTVNEPVALRDQGRIIAPHTENTTEQEIARLNAARSDLAVGDFRTSYAEPVEMTDQVMDTLDNREMRAAMGQAKRVAAARLDDPEAAKQVHDIGKLEDYFTSLDKYEADHAAWTESGGWDLSALDPTQKAFLEKANPTMRDTLLEQLGGQRVAEPVVPTPPTITGGALDRIRIAAQRLSESLKNVPGGEPKPTHDLGVAIGQRASSLGRALDQVPHLAEARAVYHAHSIRMGALREGEGHLVGDSTRKFQAWFDGLTEKVPPEQKPELISQIKNDLRVSLRDALEGRGKRGVDAAGLLNKIADGTGGLQDNIKHVLGDDEGNRLIGWARQQRKDFESAQFVGGGGSSLTAHDLGDEESVSKMLAHPSMMAMVMQSVRDALHDSALISPEEAHALRQYALGDTAEILRIMKQHPESHVAKAVQFGLSSTLGGAIGGAFAAPVVSPSGDKVPVNWAPLPQGGGTDVPAPTEGGPEAAPPDPSDPYAKYVAAPIPEAAGPGEDPYAKYAEPATP